MTGESTQLKPADAGSGIGRREFLKRASVGGAGLALLYVAPQFTTAGAKSAYASITPVVTGTETAFGYGGPGVARCFIDDDYSNWGWTNGPLSEGNYSFDLIAGAGGCDLSKGTDVGSVDISYSGGTLTATYLTVSPYVLDTVQLYAGAAMYPFGSTGVDTTAPGHYTKVVDDLGGVTSHTVTVTGLSGSVYVIAHADVSGF